MKFDREKLSDCFDSASLAKEIRHQFNLKPNAATPLRAIADAVGIWQVTEKNLTAIEGALIVPEGKFEGQILLNNNQHPERKRFTFAHEIGHFVHPLHHPANEGRFECNTSDVFQSYGRESFPDMENEANEFASELLLPANSLYCVTGLGSSLDFDQIIHFCETMKVSKAFAIRKFQNMCTAKTAFIFSHEGKIRYLQRDGFPFLKSWSKQPLPSHSYATESAPENTILEKKEVSSDVWLKLQTRSRLFEQTYVQEKGYRITMLILE